MRTALLLLLPGLLAADVRFPALRTLDGKTLVGEVTALGDKEVVLKAGGTEVRTPIDKVLQIDFLALPAAAPSKDPYSLVELTDGSQLQCQKFAARGKEATLTLTGGQEVKVPLAAVAYLLNEAQDEAQRQQIAQKFLAKKRTTDLLLIKRSGTVNALEGTLGDADEQGESIDFTLSGAKRQVKLANVHGLVFVRPPDPAMPPALCKLLDTRRNVVFVANVQKTPTGFTVQSPAGAKIDYPKDQVVRLDYSKGKLTFLSDLEPAKVVETSTEGEGNVQHYSRDKNLDGQPIRVGKIAYSKGLCLHSHTELEFDLKGEYREMKAVLGVDSSVEGLDGPVAVKIEGDGKELFSAVVRRSDKESKPLALSVKDVFKLKITVASAEGPLFLDLGKHVVLAEARVSK